MSDLSKFLHTAETDLTTWLGEAEADVVAGAEQAWALIAPALKALEPAAWAQALPIILQAIADIANGDLADIETSVLNKAEVVGLTIFEDIKGVILQAVIALVKAFHV